MDLMLLNGANHPLLANLEKNENVRVHKLSEGSVYNPFHIFKIKKFLDKYDLVHVHLFPSLYWTAIAKFLMKSPANLVYTEHNTSNRRRRPILRLLDNFIYRQYKQLIAISAEVEANLRSHLQDAKSKIALINNGVDLDRIRTAQPYERSEFVTDPNTKILIQISSFTKQKDQRTLINAIPKINHNVLLLLVGEGETLKDHKALVNKLGLQGQVRFLGVRMDVPELLKTADIVVLSSHYEGLSLSSIEGLASGAPFIASNVSGLSTIVSGAGILFTENDPRDLAEHIITLIDNPEFAKEIAATGLKRAENYSIEKMVDAHIRLYTKLWNKK